MVEHLQHYGVISSKKVAEVMATIDRALFVPDGTAAYVDSPMDIGTMPLFLLVICMQHAFSGWRSI